MGNYRNFTLTTYFVAHATARVTETQLEDQLGFILKHLRLDKVYLEPFRGELASPEQVDMCRRVFERHGVRVAGSLTTVMPTPEGSRPKARLFNTLCYNDPATRNSAMRADYIRPCKRNPGNTGMPYRTEQMCSSKNYTFHLIPFS